MPKMPCPNPPSLCQDPASPISNTSSEDQDAPVFVAINNGDGNDQPPLGLDFTEPGGVGTGTSIISQDDADNQAQQDQVDDSTGNATTPDTPPPPQPPDNPGNPDTSITEPIGGIPTYKNQQVKCAVGCPDGGSDFVYTFPAGQVSATTQAQADSIAYSKACNKAHQLKVCLLSIISPYICKDQSGSVTIHAVCSSNVTMSINGGSLPPGMSFHQAPLSFDATVSGIATVAGVYAFSVLAVSNAGAYMQRTYSVQVCEVGIADPMPDGKMNAAYPPGTTATFSVAQGLFGATGLPGGMQIEAHGLISGTPTEKGDFTPTIYANINAASCSKSTHLHICDCILEDSLPSGIKGTPYTATLTPDCSPTHCTQSGTRNWWIGDPTVLPDGLGINPTGDLGTISGTPTTAGDFSVTIFTSDNNFTCSEDFTIHIAEPPPTLCPCTDWSVVAPPDGKVNQWYSFDFGAGLTNCSTLFAISDGAIPDGLSLGDPSVGLIEGIPSTDGTFTFTLDVSYGANVCSKIFQVYIAPEDLPPDDCNDNVPGTTCYMWQNLVPDQYGVFRGDTFYGCAQFPYYDGGVGDVTICGLTRNVKGVGGDYYQILG